MASDRFIFTQIDVAPGAGNTTVDLGGNDFEVPSRFTVTTHVKATGTVEMDVVVEGGRARTVAVRITERANGDGINGLAMSKVSLQSIVSHSLEVVARSSYEQAGMGKKRARKVADASTRRRTPVTDSRLDDVLRDYAAGGIDAVVERHHVSERQGFRLLKQARDRRGDGGVQK